MGLRSDYGFLKTDVEDFRPRNYSGHEVIETPLCRGKGLYRMIDDLSKGGWPADPDLGVSGGFSDSPMVCKQFAARGMQSEGPPSVYYADRNHYKEQHPSLQPIQYDEKWLAEHPNVTGICQTFPGKERRRSTDKEVSSAMCYRKEREWFAEEDIKPLNLKHSENYYLQGNLNIYLDDFELRRMGLDVDHYSNNLGKLCPKLKEAVTMLENFIPEDLPVRKYGGVRVYYCDSHSDLENANSSGTWCNATEDKSCKYNDPIADTACTLVGYLEPKGKPYKDGFKYPEVFRA